MRIELSGITKSFAGHHAVRDVNLDIAPGEILALVGQNGAGKSTLMNILFGLTRPDAGEIRIDGHPVAFGSPAEAISAGLAMVHQHSMLIPSFTVLENLILGNEPTGMLGRIDVRNARRMFDELSSTWRIQVDPDARVDELSVARRTGVELLRALSRGARCIILDEPSLVADTGDGHGLKIMLRQLAEAGNSVIVITHRLTEAIDLGDRLAVMSEGTMITSDLSPAVGPTRLSELIMGGSTRPPGSSDQQSSRIGCPGDRHPDESSRGIRLRVEDLVVNGQNGLEMHPASFQIATGEIAVIAAIDGNGQEELIDTIGGLGGRSAGRVELDGVDVANSHRWELLDLGLAHIPRDRHRGGLVMDMTVAENLALGRTARDPSDAIESFAIVPTNPASSVSSLSGGNQQKVVIAREITYARSLLLAENPFRGLDTGTVRIVRERIRGLAGNGVAVLAVLSDIDEILAIADRIMVMVDGRISDPFDSNELDHLTLMQLMSEGL